MKQLSFKEYFLNVFFFYMCNNIRLSNVITNCINALRYKCNDFDEKNEEGKYEEYKTYTQMVCTQSYLHLTKIKEIIINHHIRMEINTSWHHNNKKPFEIRKTTLHLDSTNISRTHYEDPREEPRRI